MSNCAWGDDDMDILGIEAERMTNPTCKPALQVPDLLDQLDTLHDPLPQAIKAAWHVSSIWPDTHPNCPCWTLKADGDTAKARKLIDQARGK